MENQIEVARYDSNDISHIVKLTLTTYAGSEIADERYLYWEYKINPAGNAVINVAKSEDKIVSQYAIIPRTYSFSGKLLKGSLSINTITHPDFRGKNLFKLLAERTFENCDEENILFTIGFPNPYSLPVIRKKNIFHVAGNLTVLFKPLKPVSIIYHLIHGKKVKRGKEIPVAVPVSDDTNLEEFHLGSSNDKLNSFLLEFHKSKIFTTYRNADFLKWRYADIPRRTYFCLKHETDKINCLIIYRAKYIYGIRCLIIVDIISLRSVAVESCLEEIKKIALHNKIDLILSAITPHSEEYSQLKSGGYFSIPESFLPQKLTFIIRKHKNCPEEAMFFEDWFLTFGDYDIF